MNCVFDPFSVKYYNSQLSRLYIISYNGRVLAAGGCHKLQSQGVRNGSGSGQAAAAALVTPESGARAGAEDTQLVPALSLRLANRFTEDLRLQKPSKSTFCNTC